jgi:periplasmic protein TonB
MRRFLGIFCAIVFHLAILLFGGLVLLGNQEKPKEEKVLMAEIFSKDDKPKEDPKDKERPQEKPPETRQDEKPPDVVEEVRKLNANVVQLDQPATNPNAEALASLNAIGSLLNGEMGGDSSFGAGGLATLQPGGGGGGAIADDGIISVNDLDQKPRVTYQVAPVLSGSMRTQVPATVRIAFIVGPDGKVTNPKILQSSNPLFDEASVAAVKQWKFEPGKHNGKEVAFRMSVPITFPKRQ